VPSSQDVTTEREISMATLADKLHPGRFTAMSPKMAAILAYLLGSDATWETDPAIVGLVVTSDGFVLAELEGDVGANDWIGALSDLEGNLRRLVDVAELTVVERKTFNARCVAGVSMSSGTWHGPCPTR
jgi:hypothetical protein